MPDQNPTLASLIAFAQERLLEAGVSERKRIVELFASHTFGITPYKMTSVGDSKPPATLVSEFERGIDRLAAHEPLQYVMGEAIFMGYALKVDSSVLIPRPETEQLVELAVNALKIAGGASGTYENLAGLDIGTGSGNIPIALCKMLPGLKMICVDASNDALSLAKSNIISNGLTDYIAVNYCDVLKSIPDIGERFDFIISNPPYISVEEFEQLEPNVRTHEPRVALTDGGDGLTFYRRIAEIGSDLLKPSGRIFLEVAYNQAHSVSAILEESGYGDIVISKDYAGFERFVSSQLSSNGQ